MGHNLGIGQKKRLVKMGHNNIYHKKCLMQGRESPTYPSPGGKRQHTLYGNKDPQKKKKVHRKQAQWGTLLCVQTLLEGGGIILWNGGKYGGERKKFPVNSRSIIPLYGGMSRGTAGKHLIKKGKKWSTKQSLESEDGG